MPPRDRPTVSEARIGTPFAIRPFVAADRDGLVALWERCGLRVSYNDPDRDIALWCASPNAEIFVGTFGERIVASVCIGHDGHRGNPYYVAVHPAARGKGYGAAMMRHAEAWLAARGVAKMNVMVRDTNAAVCGFYRAIGYEETPRLVLGRWLTEDGQPPPADAPGVPTLDCTITYLEMTERPAHLAVPPPRGVRIAFLHAHQPSVRFYRYLYDTVGEPWLWYERRAMDDETLRAIIQDEGVEIYVLYVEGVPAGFAELDRRTTGEIELAYFGLMPEFIGRRLGPYLLGSVLDTAWAHEPERVWVNTNTLDHPKALAVYQRFGFRPYDQLRKTIPDPRATGLIASRD